MAKKDGANKRKMSVLSFDIGIKNLSFCFLEGDTPNNHSIKDWGIWDLRLERQVKNENIQDEAGEMNINAETIQNNKIKCSCKGKKGKPCRSKPLFYESVGEDTMYYCRVHLDQRRSPFMEEDVKQISKKKKSECLELIQERQIPITNDDYSTVYELKKILKEYISLNSVKKIKKPRRCKTFPLDKLHSNLYQYITNFLKGKHITKVQIENQPVKINATMKTIQIMLYSIIQSYYYEHPELPVPDVTFLNAKYKGTIYDGPDVECKTKDPYRRRKLLSVAHSRYFLELTEQDKWLEYFSGNNKKDDLADAYLMCLYFLKDN